MFHLWFELVNISPDLTYGIVDFMYSLLEVFVVIPQVVLTISKMLNDAIENLSSLGKVKLVTFNCR